MNNKAKQLSRTNYERHALNISNTSNEEFIIPLLFDILVF